MNTPNALINEQPSHCAQQATQGAQQTVESLRKLACAQDLLISDTAMALLKEATQMRSKLARLASVLAARGDTTS